MGKACLMIPKLKILIVDRKHGTYVLFLFLRQSEIDTEMPTIS